jgi:hypothetical protein
MFIILCKLPPQAVAAVFCTVFYLRHSEHPAGSTRRIIPRDALLPSKVFSFGV